MPTFIALQCFQCSTMQVKQQKKSSNKWSCVVCNEKQSVRKVFAQSCAAKDIRQFVQCFNLSRQSSDQNNLISEELDTSCNDELNKLTKKKRNDWTEYIDEDGDTRCGDEKVSQGDELEGMVVTEMPKPLFKKPKLRDYSSNKHGTEKLFKPVFSSRINSNQRHGKDQCKDDLQMTNEFGQTSCARAAESKGSDFIKIQGNCSDEEKTSNRAAKWGNFRAQIQERNDKLDSMEEAFVPQPTMAATRLAKGLVSKWNSFITEEDEDKDYGLQRGLWDSVSRDENDVLDSLVNDQRVEDDIHPDFL